MPDKTEEKQGKFQKGRSGNPFGRPKGGRNKATLLAEKLLENEAEEIRTRTAYYDMDKDWRFYRVLSHWDLKGLIECERFMFMKQRTKRLT